MKKNYKTSWITAAAATAGLVLFMTGNASAAITQQCGYCHTMHNSQDGAGSMLTPVGMGGSSSTINGALLRWDCIGCHTGNNEGAVPFVLRTDGEPGYVNGDDATGTANNSLAGGDFYWVDTGTDSTGHNVDLVIAADVAIGETPPGWDNTVDTDIHDAAASWSTQLTCSGTYGCHGDNSVDDSMASVSGAHHGQVDGTVDGTTVAKSYRFLNGILGKEDADHEYSRQANDHNQYKAVDRAKTDAADLGAQTTSTISYLCAKCHGKFHQGATDDGSVNASNAWIRHPTEYDIGNSSNAAYEAYGTTYLTAVPVGSTAVDSTLSTIAHDSDQAIVTCISCHRAHGSPYADLLRWDYATDCFATGSSGTAANCGCFKCHTDKD